MSTHIIPITYGPKIEPVFSRECTQTIRKVKDPSEQKRPQWSVGDKIIIHDWMGKPYWSKWGRRIDGIVTEMMQLKLMERVIYVLADNYTFGDFDSGDVMAWHFWDTEWADELARRDFIEPPSGEALKEVLKKLNGPDWEGDYRVIRWETIEEAVD